LSTVAKEGLAAAKKPLRKMSVRNGAMLRICERRNAPRLFGRLRSAAGAVTLSPVAMILSIGAFSSEVDTGSREENASK
jgi:hypothetical protein